MRDLTVGNGQMAALIAAMMGGVHREQGMPQGPAQGMPAPPQAAAPTPFATAQQMPQQPPQGAPQQQAGASPYDLGRPRRPGDPGWPWLP